MSNRIRKTTFEDKEKLLSIIASSGQFDEDDLGFIRETLEEHLADPDSEALWYTAHEDEPVGVAYCNPEPLTLGTWNLLMLWMQSGLEGKGHGAALVNQLEEDLLEKDARLLIVETSSLEYFAPARAFYEKSDFKLEASIKDFYEPGDDKLVYTKSLLAKI